MNEQCLQLEYLCFIAFLINILALWTVLALLANLLLNVDSRLITRLVPSLKPVPECTKVPKETCVLKFGWEPWPDNHDFEGNTFVRPAELVNKPLRTEWCLDDTDGFSTVDQQDDEDYTDEEGEEESTKPVSYKRPERTYKEATKSPK